jgi:hypothetical protein
LKYSLTTCRLSDFRVDLTNPSPIDADIRATIDANIGNRLSSARPYIASGQNCGYVYRPDQPDDRSLSTFSSGCYLAYAYPKFDTLFNVIEGTAPQPRVSDDDPVQGVITTTMQADSGWEIGHVIIYGEDTRTAVLVEIVGIIEPTIPLNDPFWTLQTIFHQFIFFFSDVDSRLETTFIVHPDDYMAHISPAQETTFYRWRLILDRRTLTVGEVPVLEAQLQRLADATRTDYPELEIRTSFDELLQNFRESVTTTQQPIFFLSALMLVPMLYSMVLITTLVQEQQESMWALFASRGASPMQLVGIQFITILILNIIAVLIAPLLALGLLWILTLVGPQASIINATHIGGVNATALTFTILAAVVLQITLLLPAWQGATNSVLYLKRASSRPVHQPAWSRYYLDVAMLAIGILLLLRLYNLTTGAHPLTLLQDPGLLLSTLASNDITMFLSDPFSIAAPALLLTGLTLFWMRVFPLLIGLLGRTLGGNDGLLMRLAFWNVERDPAHYSRLVLLLIGTLAMGTASLILNATHDSGAWAIARATVGADATVTLDVPYSEIDWQSLPEVESATSVLMVESQSPLNSVFMGVDTQTATSELSDIAALIADDDYAMGGQVLPNDLVSVALDVVSLPPEDVGEDFATRLGLVLEDNSGRRFVVALNTLDPTLTTTLMTYEARLPTTISPPMRLYGIMFNSTQNVANVLQHTLYLDNLRGMTADGTSQLLVDFEADMLADWSWTRESGQGLPNITLDAIAEHATTGTTALEVNYLLRPDLTRTRVPLLQLRFTSLAPIPVVISPDMAQQIRQHSRLEDTPQVGDVLSLALLVDNGTQAALNVSIDFVIVAIQEVVQIVGEADSFMIAEQDLLLQQINANGGAKLGLRAEDVRLTLTNREPTAQTRDALANTAGIRNATFAWDNYQASLRAPLPNAISGTLFAGFWVMLLLTTLDFGFYLAVTIRQRSTAFATLQALGWQPSRITQLLLIEQTLFVIPALVMGVLVGVLLSALIVPFLSLVGNQPLQLPFVPIVVLVVILVAVFIAILRLMTMLLDRLDVTRVMRFGE